MNFEEMEFVGVATITGICYLAGIIVKTMKNSDHLIPIVCGILGGILGIVGLFVIPEFPAEDPLTAAGIGIVSGMAATGINQIGKQIKKGGTP